MRHFFIVFILFILGLSLKAQTSTEETVGTVSFVTSQSVYVKYPSTAGIIVGDTLFSYFNNQLIPALIVKNLSSSSVVCSFISANNFNVNDKIIAKRRLENKKTEIIKPPVKDNLIEASDTSKAAEKGEINKNTHKQKINGTAGISSISNFSNTPYHPSYIFNYALALNIRNIADSKFSFESNMVFRQENGEWSNVQKNIFNGLKIYDLSLIYDINKDAHISLGRRINPNISNIGAIDGLQAEKSIGNISVGAFAGFRPDYSDYGFNTKLLQYGAYIGHNLQTSKRNMQNSLAIAEQMNNLKTDRRFLYFQHNSSLLKNVQLFCTSEIDLYRFLNEQKQNTASLTSTYLSLRYRPFRKLMLSGTYDTRKNVIYYETDKDYLSTLIEKETRQGAGAQLNYNIYKNIYFGARGGYRFQKSDTRPTRNAYLFLTHNNLFKSQISTTLSATLLETNYLNGQVYNLRFSRAFNSGKMNLSTAYSYVHYKIMRSQIPLIQHIANLSISTEVVKKLYFSLNFEDDLEKSNQFYRLYVQIKKRF